MQRYQLKASIYGVLFWLIFLASSSGVRSQKIFRSADVWGDQKGTCVALIEGNKFFRSDGAFCQPLNCQYLLEDNKVFKTSGAFGTFKEKCLLIQSGTQFYKSDDVFGNFFSELIFEIEGSRIYESYRGSFRGDCVYIWEGDKVYYAADRSGFRKGDCVYIIEGRLPKAFLMALLLKAI